MLILSESASRISSGFSVSAVTSTPAAAEMASFTVVTRNGSFRSSSCTAPCASVPRTTVVPFAASAALRMMFCTTSRMVV